MEEPQQNLHDGLDYPGSSLLHIVQRAEHFPNVLLQYTLH